MNGNICKLQFYFVKIFEISLLFILENQLLLLIYYFWCPSDVFRYVLNVCIYL